MPNLTVDQVYRFRFTTSLNGVPTVLLGSPVVSIYKDADLTQSVAGVTLTVSFDGVVGLNLVEIDTADAFYTPLTDFSAVITTGTVGGLSVVGSVIDNFTIEHEYPAPSDNADGLLARDIAGGSSVGPRTVSQGLSTLRNKQSIVAGVYTCYEADDLTPLFESLVTTAPGNPLTSWSPTT